MSVHIARIQWLLPEEGGRNVTPPGPTYSTAARFEKLWDRWPSEAWSVVLDIPTESGQDRTVIASIRMLVGGKAPRGLLVPGSRFDLYEGQHVVAHGEVIR